LSLDSDVYILAVEFVFVFQLPGSAIQNIAIG